MKPADEKIILEVEWIDFKLPKATYEYASRNLAQQHYEGFCASCVVSAVKWIENGKIIRSDIGVTVTENI